MSTASAFVVPGAPESLDVVAGAGLLVASWSAPRFDGGRPVTSYTATAKIGGVSQGTCTTASLSCAIGALTNGTEYVIEVTATNAVGTGPAVTGIGTPEAVPSAPQDVSATGFTSGVRVTWTAPSTNGGSAITSYVAQAFAAASGGSAIQSCTTSSASETTCQIEPLTAGTAYYVSVSAANTTGDGAPSTRIRAVAGATPSAPRSVTGSRVQSGVQVSWQAPSDTGSSGVSSYIARAYTSEASGASEIATCSTSSLTCVITSLSDAVVYYVSVAALNSVGEGPASSRVRVPIATAPGAPRNVAAAVGNGFTEVTWNPPESTGGSAITRYVARAYDVAVNGSEIAQCSPTGNSLQCDLGPLPNGSTYYVDVTATNSFSDGPASSPRVSVVPGTQSTPPSNVTAVNIPEGIAVQWSVPTADGGYVITSYQARAWSAATGGTMVGSCSSTGTQCVIVPQTLAPVYIDVIAITGLGDSAASSPRIRLIPAEPLDLVTGVSVVTSGSKWKVTWQEPEDASSKETIAYVAALEGAGGQQVASCSTTLSRRVNVASCSLKRPSSASALTVSVTAQTGDSRSESTPVGLGKIKKRPSVPLTVTSAPGTATLEVEWEPPARQGASPVSMYRVRAWSSSQAGRVVSSCTRESTDPQWCVLDGLSDYVPIWVDVTARNGAGWGAPTARIRLMSKESVPEAVTGVRVVATSDGFKATWDKQVFDGGFAIRRFVVRVSADEQMSTILGSCSAGPTDDRCVVGQLPAGTHAWISVAAVNAVGAGAPVITQGTVPFPN